MNFFARGGEVGAIAQKGKELFKQYDYACLRHPKPTMMTPTHTEDIDGTITLGKQCPKCGQFILEGSYNKNDA